MIVPRISHWNLNCGNPSSLKITRRLLTAKNSKSGVPARVPWVRIPPCPPHRRSKLHIACSGFFALRQKLLLSPDDPLRWACPGSLMRNRVVAGDHSSGRDNRKQADAPSAKAKGAPLEGELLGKIAAVVCARLVVLGLAGVPMTEISLVDVLIAVPYVVKPNKCPRIIPRHLRALRKAALSRSRPAGSDHVLGGGSAGAAAPRLRGKPLSCGGGYEKSRVRACALCFFASGVAGRRGHSVLR